MKFEVASLISSKRSLTTLSKGSHWKISLKVIFTNQYEYLTEWELILKGQLVDHLSSKLHLTSLFKFSTYKFLLTKQRQNQRQQ